jgi:hypothetical protein
MSMVGKFGPYACSGAAAFRQKAKRLNLLRVARGLLTDLLAHGPRRFHPHVAAGAAHVTWKLVC